MYDIPQNSTCDKCGSAWGESLGGCVSCGYTVEEYVKDCREDARRFLKASRDRYKRTEGLRPMSVRV